jgi:hypothetical protein
MKKVLISFVCMLIGFTTLAKHLPNRPELKTVRSNDKVELKLDIGEIKLLNDVDLKKVINENLFDQLNEFEKNTACKITINGFYVEEYGNRTISLVITGTTEELLNEGCNNIAIDIITQFKNID